MKERISVTIIEDSPAYRQGIESGLESCDLIEAIHAFGTVEGALNKLDTVETDLILLDLNLPTISGLEAIPLLQTKVPNAKIIILTQSDRESDVIEAIQSGAAGYLLKSATIDEIIEGIERVHAGGATLDPNLARFILDTLHTSLSPAQTDTRLSKREFEILTRIAQGLSQKQIAADLEISSYTVTEYVVNIYKKLEVPNAPAAVAKAYKYGILGNK
ncbi:MAG: response regulator [Opitutales bacterium]